MSKTVQQVPAPAARYPETTRTVSSAFAHHGKPLRGLMSTPKSPSFQGRFGRMFRSLPAATYGTTDAESRLALMTLGEAMTSGFDAEESGIPALYTYCGQFIDHDITEVFLGLLFGDNDSFLSADPEWSPTIGEARDKFALRDLVAYALAQ